MLGLWRLLVAVSVLAAQGGTFVTAREEERRGLRGLNDENDENDSTHNRNEIFKDESNLKASKQHNLSGDDIHTLELSLPNGASTRIVGGEDTNTTQYPYY
eukprot:scaffold80087_cov67-Attheya_sp.AAC.2